MRKPRVTPSRKRTSTGAAHTGEAKMTLNRMARTMLLIARDAGESSLWASNDGCTLFDVAMDMPRMNRLPLVGERSMIAREKGPTHRPRQRRPSRPDSTRAFFRHAALGPSLAQERPGRAGKSTCET